MRTQKQHTPTKDPKVIYTYYKLKKAKESMQAINMYTKVQSRNTPNTKRENSKGHNTTKKYTIILIMCCKGAGVIQLSSVQNYTSTVWYKTIEIPKYRSTSIKTNAEKFETAKYCH